MDDLIKFVRLDVIDDLVKEFASNGGNSYFIVDGQEYHTDTGYAMEGIELFVEKLKERVSKEIEQPERKTGKWIPHSEKCREYIGTVLVNVEYDYWFCDTCGYRVKKGQPMYNFCPNCGMKMEEG